MAKVQNDKEILPKVSTAHWGAQMLQTTDRQTELAIAKTQT